MVFQESLLLLAMVCPKKSDSLHPSQPHNRLLWEPVIQWLNSKKNLAPTEEDTSGTSAVNLLVSPVHCRSHLVLNSSEAWAPLGLRGQAHAEFLWKGCHKTWCHLVAHPELMVSVMNETLLAELARLFDLAPEVHDRGNPFCWVFLAWNLEVSDIRKYWCAPPFGARVPRQRKCVGLCFSGWGKNRVTSIWL